MLPAPLRMFLSHIFSSMHYSSYLPHTCPQMFVQTLGIYHTVRCLPSLKMKPVPKLIFRAGLWAQHRTKFIDRKGKPAIIRCPPPDNTTRPVAPATGHRPICMLLRGRSILRHRARPPPRIEHFRRRRARFWQYRRRKSRPPTINWRNPSFPPPFSPPFSSFPPPIYSSP